MDNIEELFDRIPATFKTMGTNPTDAVILLNITGNNPAQYHISIDNGQSSVVKGGINDPNLTLSCSADDLIKLSKGELDPGKAFMTGRLAISGDISIALRLLGQMKSG